MPNARRLVGGNWQGVSPFFEDDAENWPIAGTPSGEDGGGSIAVIAYWPGFWAGRRAAQLQVSWEFQDGAAPPPEQHPHAAFRARVLFGPLGRTQFRFGATYDESFVAPEEPSTAPIWLARPRFLPLGRTQFRFGATYDLDAPFSGQESAGFIARYPLRGLGRTPFRFQPALDEPPAAPPEFEQNPHLFVRWLRNPYDARRAAVSLYVFATLDEDAPAPPAVTDRNEYYRTFVHNNRR